MSDQDKKQPTPRSKGGEGAGPGSTDDFWLHEDVMNEEPDGSNTWTFDLVTGRMVKKKPPTT